MNQLALNDFLKYRFLSQLKTSPSQQHLSFVSAQARFKNNDYVYSLYLSTGKRHQKIIDLKNKAHYFWESDDTLLVVMDRTANDEKLTKDKHTVVYRYYVNSQKFEKAYVFKFPITSLEVIDGDYLLLGASLREHQHVYYTDNTLRKETLKKEADETFFEEFDEIPFQSNGLGFSYGIKGQLFLYAIANDTYTPLAGKQDNVLSHHIDSVNHRLYFNASSDQGVKTFYSDLYQYDFKNKRTTTLYDKKELAIRSFFAIKDQLFVLASDLKDYGMNQNNDLYRIQGKDMEFVASFGFSDHNSIGSDCRLGASQSTHVLDDTYYFTGTLRDRNVIYRCDGTDIQPVFSAAGSLDGWVRFKDAYYGIGQYHNTLQELYQLDWNDNTVNRISRLNQSIHAGKHIAQPQHIEFENDSQTLDGWVLLPENYSDDQKHPAILVIHGGPKTIYSNTFYHEMHAWTNQGYVVFFTNPRGGDCYGNDFMDIRGKYGTLDYDDVMTFTDIVMDRYAIDPDRVGVTGGSYGGFMTSWIVSHTDRFKCAAAQRAVTNWISFYGASDIGYHFGADQTAADPIDDVEKAWQQSPLKHAKNIKTPLLILHSDADHRCPIDQALQLFTAVKKNGTETKFVWFKGENHDLSRSGKPQARLKRLQEITRWMDHYLK